MSVKRSLAEEDLYLQRLWRKDREEWLRRREQVKLLEYLGQRKERKLEAAPEPQDELDYFGIEKLRLGQDLERIGEEINSRLELHFDQLDEIQRETKYVEWSLEEFEHWGVGYNTGVDVKRNHLERLLAERRKEHRGTRLSAWEDIVALRKLLRETEEKYLNLVRRERLTK